MTDSALEVIDEASRDAELAHKAAADAQAEYNRALGDLVSRITPAKPAGTLMFEKSDEKGAVEEIKVLITDVRATMKEAQHSKSASILDRVTIAYRGFVIGSEGRLTNREFKLNLTGSEALTLKRVSESKGELSAAEAGAA